MKKGFYILIFSFLFSGLFTLAQEGPPEPAPEALAEITYPIPELGNCASEAECLAYCEIPENALVCLDFAEAHNLIPREEIEMARKMLETTGTIGGPGGCVAIDECEAYCRIPEHVEECIVFAMENDLIPPDELEEAQKALAAIRAGATPPPCAGKEECDIYCADPAHLEECLEFGIAANFISDEEAEMARKTGGVGPGGCRGKAECDAYCQDPAHLEECINFAIEHGIMPPDEMEDAQKMLEALKKGVKPPPCQGKEECEIYCSEPAHVEECMNFAVAAGFMSEEEAETMKKMAEAGIFGGPGGCTSEEECEAYCEDPAHTTECIEFAVKAGFMTPEEGEMAMRAGGLGIAGGPGGCRSQVECEAYCQDPAHMDECFDYSVAHGYMTPEEAAEGRRMMEMEAAGLLGPGGCTSQEECATYCGDPAHTEECMSFGQAEGLMTPEEVEILDVFGPGGPGGPGGCMSGQECEAYCSDPAHADECFEFSVGQGMMAPEEAEMMRGRMMEEVTEMEEIEEMMEMMGPPPEMMMPPPEEMMMPPEEMPMPPPEMMPPEGMPPEEFLPPEGIPPEMMPPPEVAPPPEEIPIEAPPPEEIMPPPEEIAPPPEEAPQTLLEQIQQFLANVAAAFGF